jgi:hypothetical protein
MSAQAHSVVLFLAAWLLLPVLAAPADRMVAKVNGEPIRASQILPTLPKDLIPSAAEDIRDEKLDRLIERTQTRQFLDGAKVKAAPAEVAAALADLRKHPPSAGCPCHRFATLEQYMEFNYLTLPEVREDLRNRLRWNRYLDAQWRVSLKTEKPDLELRAAKRTVLEEDYARASHIFFNTYPRVDQKEDPEQLRVRARTRADAAWKRLQAGADFATLARQVSEDQVSRERGGALGLIPREAYGREFAFQLRRLKPGETSKPFAGTYGYHILRRGAITDRDMQDLERREFRDRKGSELSEQIRKGAKVEKLGWG